MIKFLFLVLLVHKCTGAIYHLNETEYERMPPLFALDEYEACLSHIGGVYCLVKMDLHAEPSNDLIKLIHEYSEVTSKHYNHTYIERGVCVRKTCQKFFNNSAIYTQEDLNGVLEACLNESIWNDYGLQAKLGNVYYCDKNNEQKETDALDIIVAIICLLIVVINIFASYYDYILNKTIPENEAGRGNQFLLSFSMIRNWNWLVASEPEEERLQRLNCLHGVRSFTNIMTILAHAVWIIATGFTDKPHDFEKTYETVYYQVLYNGMVIVQIFFLISGFLLVYNFKIRAEIQPISWKMIPKVMFLRWWRLTPAYAVMLALTATWLRHAGSGPLWNLYVTDTVVADCRQYWWHHLLYINNYFPDDKFCLIQTWHIAADTQIFLVGLVVYIATQSRGRNLVLTLLLLLGIAAPAIHVWVWNMDGVLMMVPEFYRTMKSDTFRYLHVFGHNNLPCFIIGMFLGSYIYNLQLKKVDISQNKIINFMVWLVIPGVILLMYSGHVFYADAERASLAVRMLYAGFHRFVMGILVAFALSAFILKCQNTIRDIYEWRGWLVPSRLSYSMYLLHFNLVYIFLGVRTQLAPVSFYYLIIYHIGLVGLSLLFALPYFLMVEAPMNRLLKVITTKTPVGNENMPAKEANKT